MDNVQKSTPVKGFMFNGEFSPSLDLKPFMTNMERRLKAIRGEKTGAGRENMSTTYEAYQKRSQNQNN